MHNQINMALIPESIYDFRYPENEKEQMKKTFIFYLWGMFNEPGQIMNPHTIYIRNAVWHYRNLVFRNRIVFHWIINVLFQEPWRLQEVQDIVLLRKQLRDFFRMIVNKLIHKFSPEDLGRLNYYTDTNPRIAGRVLHELSLSVADYERTFSDVERQGRRERLEETFYNVCQQRWTAYRERQAQINVGFVAQSLPGDIFTRILNEADHTDTVWVPPESLEQVTRYIEGLNGWNEM
jgi:hypothetical protein